MEEGLDLVDPVLKYPGIVSLNQSPMPLICPTNSVSITSGWWKYFQSLTLPASSQHYRGDGGAPHKGGPVLTPTPITLARNVRRSGENRGWHGPRNDNECYNVNCC